MVEAPSGSKLILSCLVLSSSCLSSENTLLGASNARFRESCLTNGSFLPNSASISKERYLQEMEVVEDQSEGS